MANKIKKLFIVGTLVTGLFMSLTGCDLSNSNNSSNQSNISGSIAGSVSSEPAALTGISVTNNKENYEWGEDLDITVTATYADGTTSVITDYQVTGYNSKVPGEQDVLVTYEGNTYSLKVKVNDPILVNINVVDNRDDYEWGDELDITVTATYSDGSTTTITDYEVEGYDKEQSGEQDVTITYGGKSTSLKVKVNNPVLVRVDVTNNREDYEWGEDLDITVTATYSDGSTRVVTDYEVEGYNKENSGEQDITITYEGKSTSLKVKVKDPALVSITAISNKDSYEYGDELDITVIATYSDCSTVEVTNYQVEGYNSENPGIQNLTITFEDKSCSLNVSVKERVNKFPTTELNEFLQVEAIQIEIPSPIGYDTWTNGVELEQDGSKYFVSSTKDEGTVGTDSIADQYAVLLETNGWTVNKENNEYTANKEGADALVSFSTKASVFSLRVEQYCEFPDKAIMGSVINAKTALRVGTTIVLGNVEQEIIVTGLGENQLDTKMCTYIDNGPSSVAKNVVRFTLDQNAETKNWILSDVYGRKLGSTGAGELAWDEGSTEWTIIFSNGNAVIMNATKSYGRICFNPDTGAMTTYSSVAGTNLVYPQLFRLVEKDLIYPTGISLSGKDQVALEKTTQLSLAYTPKNANSINEVTWSSSNEEVATVKDGVVTGVSIGEVTITATTKSKGSLLQTSFNLNVEEFVGAEWTIMIYMCGADLESGSGYASSDISEILSVNGQPDDVNIILETGGSHSWHGYGINANYLSHYHVENKSLVLDSQLPKANMGLQSTFESFLNWGLEEYPAYNTGVVFWNHGGALDGCCFDENFGDDSLLNSETSRAFSNVLGARGIDKLEFVGYDCCLMQVQDIAEFNSHYFNYMVASEEAEDAAGWAYDRWVGSVYNHKTTREILKANCDGSVAVWGQSSDQTLSYLDLSKMANYHAAFEAMASAIKSTAKNNYSSFKSLLGTIKDYGSGWWSSGLQSYGTIDGMDFFNKLGNNSKYTSYQSYITAVKTAYNQLVAYSKTGTSAGNSNGLAIIAAAYCSYPASETSFSTWRSIFY